MYAVPTKLFAIAIPTWESHHFLRNFDTGMASKTKNVNRMIRLIKRTEDEQIGKINYEQAMYILYMKKGRKYCIIQILV